MPSPAHIRGTVAAIVDQPDDLRELRIFHKALAHVSRLKAAGVVLTKRTGREVLCQLRPNVFDEVAERERVLLGFAGAGPVAAVGPVVGVSALPAASRIEAH